MVMSKDGKLIKPMLGLLHLGRKLGVVAEACRTVGITGTVTAGARKSAKPGW
jgi:hypothetical protein